MYLIVVGAIIMVVALTALSIYLEERKLSSMSEDEQEKYLLERDIKYQWSLLDRNKY